MEKWGALFAAALGWAVWMKMSSWRLNLAKYFHGKVVIVTGASSGIGQALALELATYKTKLLLVARREDRLQDVCNQCQKAGALKVLYKVSDLSVESERAPVIHYCVKEYGRIDVMILNAGASSLARFNQNTDLKEYHRLMELNYWSNVHLTLTALPYLREVKASVVVVSSIVGLLPIIYRTGYGPTKFALNSFFHTLRLEETDIRFNVVCPAYVDSEIHLKAYCGGNELSSNRKMSEFMSSAEAAHHILIACARNKSLYLMTWMSKLGYYLYALLPGLVEQVSIRKAKAGFSAQL